MTSIKGNKKRRKGKRVKGKVGQKGQEVDKMSDSHREDQKQYDHSRITSLLTDKIRLALVGRGLGRVETLI